MFRKFDELPRPVREKWNAKAVKGSRKDWNILQALVFGEQFPEGSYSSIREVAETAALKLYEFHDKTNRSRGVKGRGGIGGSYQALYTYALENMMEKMWRLREELQASGSVEELLSQKTLPGADEDKRQQLRIYFHTALAVLVPIFKRKGFFEFQMDKLCKFMASDSVPVVKKRPLSNAINALLGDNLDEQIIPDKLGHATKALVNAIKKQYAYQAQEEQMLDKFLADLKDRMGSSYPLETYNGQRKMGEDAGHGMGEYFSKESGISNHLAQWIEDRRKFENLREMHGGLLSGVFLNYIQHSIRAAGGPESNGDPLPEGPMRRQLHREAQPHWREQEGEEDYHRKFMAALDKAVADGVMTGKWEKAIEALKRQSANGQELSDAELARGLDVTRERAAQILANIGAKLVENGYIRLEELRQNRILITPRLQKLLDERGIRSGRE